MANEKTFTVQQIRNFITKQDSLGDVLYNLSEENIERANEVKYPIEGEGEE